MVKIIEVPYGIASRSGKDIYINRNLKEYPKLRKALISHELEHSSSYKFNDLKIEFSISQLKDLKKEYYKFIFTNPSSWIEYVPIWISNKQLKVSPSLLIFWLLTLTLFYLLFKLI